MKIQRKTAVLLIVAGFLLIGIAGRPVYHLARTVLTEESYQDSIPAGYADDASFLNKTAIAENFVVPINPDSAEQQLVALFLRARRDNLQISISGARHSMGGHTITPNGIVIDMTSFTGMKLGQDSSRLSVRSGTRWSEVIPFLDSHGLSVAVMQSNNDFTVGGYGLFGVILDVELDVVPNERYRVDRYATTSENYAALFSKEVTRSQDAGMAYGRLSVAPESFLSEATLIVFRRAPSEDGIISPLTSIGPLRLARTVFRGSVGSDYGKSLRWTLEKRLGGLPGVRFVSRNQLLNVSSEFFRNSSANSTDILHEYFIPEDRLEEFLVEARRIIPAHRADLLNVTVRNVLPDSDSFLPYARQRVFGLVMLFNQSRTSAANDSMQALTRELIDAVLKVDGTFYLPYRLHATQEQVELAYPSLKEFFVLKQKYDPEELFQNGFYKYHRFLY